MRFIALVALVGTPLVAGGPVDTIKGAVVHEREEAEGQIKAFQQTEAEAQSAFDDALPELENTLKNAKEDQARGDAMKEKGDADNAEAMGAVAEANNGIAAAQEQMAEDKKDCKSARATLQAAENELHGTIAAISAAVSIIKKSQTNLLQRDGKMNASVKKVVQTIALMVQANSIQTAGAEKLTALLQADAPQATEKAYESQGGGIIGILEEMQTKSEKDLEDMQKQILKKNHECQMKAMNSENLIKSLSDDVNRNKGIAAEAAAEAQEGAKQSANNARIAANTQKEIDDSTAERKRQNSEFKKAVAELQQNVRDFETAEDKIGAATEASFLQMSSDDDSADARQEVVAYLKKAAYKYHAVELAQVAVYAAQDPFAKVKGLINQMIDRLQKKAQEEGAKQALCMSMKKKNDDALATAGERLDKYKGRLTKAEADREQAVTDSKNASEAQAAAQKKESADIATRAANKKENAAIRAESEKFISQMGKAKEALGDMSDNITSIITGLTDEKQELLDNTNSRDEQEGNDREKAAKEFQVSSAENKQTIKMADAAAMELKKTVTEHEADIAATEKDQQIAQDEKLEIDKSCNKKPPTFEERQSKMKREIDALNNALDILDNQ